MRPDEARAIADLLRAGRAPSDARFDALLDPGLRTASGVHFTPVAVALRAAAWLVGGGAEEVADVGAGAGKLCVVGAAATGRAFTGFEVRAPLVDQARRLARRLGVAGARFVHADVRAVPLRRFRAFYAFNPFEEAEADPADWLDARPPSDGVASDAAWLGRTLAAAPEGARAAIYCGFGGELPGGWRLAGEEAHAGGTLALWLRAP